MDKENDLFAEVIKNKLANYNLPVDDDSWDTITQGLNRISRRKTQRKWIAAIAVAASIAALFLLFPINKKTHHYETADQLSNHEETIIQDVPEKEIVQPVLPQNVEHSTVFGKFQPNKRLAENNLATEVIPKKEIAEESPNVPAKEESSIQEKRPVSCNSHFDFEKETQMPVIKNKKRQSIRFSFGSGGNLLAENTANMPQNQIPPPVIYLNSPQMTYHKVAAQYTTPESRTEEILSYEYYPDIVHHLPLSFGATVKKELSRRFAIESGLVYSFVASTFSRESPQKSKADLQLHYIGIPLNIHTRILGDRFSAWEVYLSTGGMVEKGFLSHFLQKTYYGNGDNGTVLTISSNERIKGLQWSLGISPGVDYQIYKNYSIYLEPKLNYYFDNDQPVSARTKHPLVVGINAGIRYAW